MSMHQTIGQTETRGFHDDYLDSLALVERLHRLLLDVIKDEFERLGVLDINAVQALLLFNIRWATCTTSGARSTAARSASA